MINLNKITLNKITLNDETFKMLNEVSKTAGLTHDEVLTLSIQVLKLMQQTGAEAGFMALIKSKKVELQAELEKLVKYNDELDFKLKNN